MSKAEKFFDFVFIIFVLSVLTCTPLAVKKITEVLPSSQDSCKNIGGKHE